MANFNGSTSKVAINMEAPWAWALPVDYEVTSTPVHSSTTYREVLENGYTAEATGTSFVFDDSEPGFFYLSGGNVTAITVRDNLGTTVYAYTNIAIDVATIISIIDNPADNWMSVMELLGAASDIIRGGTQGDNLLGFAGDDAIYGGGGNDTIDGGEGSDLIYGGAGADSLIGGTGESTDFWGGAGNDTLVGTGSWGLAVYDDATAAITGNLGTGIVTGNASVGTDTLIDISEIWGSTYNDTLIGGSGDDAFTGDAGNDSITGGAGSDLIFYDPATTGVRVDLAAGTANDGQGGVDTLSGIENVIASEFNDTLLGSAAANSLEGDAGNDILTGRAGNDTLMGAAGIDTVDYAADADANADGLGIIVNLGGTTLVAGNWKGDAYGSVGASLAIDGWGNTDVLNNFESVIGSRYNDVISGGTKSELLEGRNGADYIRGGAGNDTLVGGAAADRLTGGAGNDVFKFVTTTEGGDAITDFASGSDKIQVVAANFGLTVGATVTLQADTGAVGTSAQFLYNTTTGALTFDRDGTGSTYAAVQIATLAGPKALTATDIQVIAS